jgi:hypothetical protein
MFNALPDEITAETSFCSMAVSAWDMFAGYENLIWTESTADALLLIYLYCH